MKPEDVMIQLAKAARIALRRPKQRTIVLPDRVIEATVATKSSYNPQALLRTLTSLELGRDAEGNTIVVEDADMKRMRLTLPFGMKAEMLVIVLVVIADNEEFMFRVSCSPDFGAVEVSRVV